MRLRNVYILGTLMQFVMFYFTKPIVPDTFRYFQVAAQIRHGVSFYDIFLFPKMIASLPWNFLVNGVVIEIVAYQTMMRMVYKVSKSQLAVFLSCCALVYQSTFILTETCLAVLLLLTVYAIQKKRYLLSGLMVLLCVSLRWQSVIIGDFFVYASAVHQNWFNQIIHTLSAWKVWVLILPVCWVCRNWIGAIPIIFILCLLFIPVPPDSFVRYLVPFLPLSVVSIISKERI